MLDPVRARRIKLLGTDVDGCLTDNGLYIGEIGGTRVELKRFDVLDGLAATLLRNAGIEMAWEMLSVWVVPSTGQTES